MGEARPEGRVAGIERSFGKLSGSLVEGGNPFTPDTKAIASDGRVGDGPERVTASGYSVTMADSLDTPVTSARAGPVLNPRGKTTVYEAFSPQRMYIGSA